VQIIVSSAFFLDYVSLHFGKEFET
jgi:hypothetical protein